MTLGAAPRARSGLAAIAPVPVLGARAAFIDELRPALLSVPSAVVVADRPEDREAHHAPGKDSTAPALQ